MADLTEYAQEYVNQKRKSEEVSYDKLLPIVLASAAIGILTGTAFLSQPWELFTGIVGAIIGGFLSIFINN